MALTAIVGNDGSVTMPTATHDAIVNAWNASFPRVVSRVSGFGDTVERNRLGILSISGSLQCVAKFDAASTSPGVKDRVAGGSALTLLMATGCSYAFTAAFSNISMSSDKHGDATLGFDFVNGDSDTVTETWDES